MFWEARHLFWLRIPGSENAYDKSFYSGVKPFCNMLKTMNPSEPRKSLGFKTTAQSPATTSLGIHSA
jgi:hypothetical protein